MLMERSFPSPDVVLRVGPRWHRALDLPLTAAEAGQGLVPPATATYLLGNAGSILIVLVRCRAQGLVLGLVASGFMARHGLQSKMRLHPHYAYAFAVRPQKAAFTIYLKL